MASLLRAVIALVCLSFAANASKFLIMGRPRHGLVPPPTDPVDSAKIPINYKYNYTQKLDHFDSTNSQTWTQVCENLDFVFYSWLVITHRFNFKFMKYGDPEQQVCTPIECEKCASDLCNSFMSRVFCVVTVISARHSHSHFLCEKKTKYLV
jgi:hypothetical protein